MLPVFHPHREIRACFDERTIRVYQAYSSEIARPALEAQKFIPPFKLSRMTWIKPSFLWMMYRCGWATKPGQDHVLAIDILRTGFEWALAHACLSHFEASVHPSQESWDTRLRESPVRIQWDPERDIRSQPLPYRSIQIGLGPVASKEYVERWTVRIEDVTTQANAIKSALDRGDLEGANSLLPVETPYPINPNLAAAIGCPPLVLGLEIEKLADPALAKSLLKNDF